MLGFELMHVAEQRWGTEAAFISAGGYHHHIGLNTWESLGGSPPPPGSTGLFHVAILYPDRARLGDALRRLLAAKIPLEGASDHGVSEALYLRDPDRKRVGAVTGDRAQRGMAAQSRWFDRDGYTPPRFGCSPPRCKACIAAPCDRRVKAVVCLDTSDNLCSPKISVLRTHRGELRARPSVYCSLDTSA